jgi:hypothetical protein
MVAAGAASALLGFAGLQQMEGGPEVEIGYYLGALSA